MVPVIHELDDHGEATGTVHFFCCVGCRSQSSYKMQDASNYGESVDCLPGTKCELCGRDVKNPEQKSYPF